MEDKVNITFKGKIISLVIVFSILFQILIPILLPFKSIAAENNIGVIETSLGTITVRKLDTTSEGIVPVEIYIEGTDIYGMNGYFNFDRTIFEELQENDIHDIANGWEFNEFQDYGEDVGYDISMSHVRSQGQNNFTACIIDLRLKKDIDITNITFGYVVLTDVNSHNTESDNPDDPYYNITVPIVPNSSTSTKYTITYNDPSGEATNMPSNGTKTEGEDYTIAEAPTRTGYTFEGWNTKADGTGTSYVAGSIYRTDENLELFAKWTPVRTTLTVNPNGGVWETFSTAQDFPGDYKTTKQISNPTSGPKGHLINFDPNGGETEELIKEQTTTFDRWTLTGGGTLNGNTYTYGTESGTLTASYVGNNIILPLATKQGHIFKGWYTAPTDGTLVGQVGESYMPDGAKRLYAQWEAIEYNLTINPAGGTYKGTTETTIEKGNFEDAIVLDTPKAPKGYTITLNNEDVITTIEQKKTFNRWIKSGKGTLEENIYTFEEGDGTLTATYTPKEVELETLTKPGYRFDGWYTLKTGGTKVESGFLPEEDMTLYAHWTAEKYTVTFNPGENATVNPTSKEVTYGEVYGTLPVPTKAGGTFLGWYNGETEITADDIVEITNNITLTAKWDPIIYTLTVNLNGGKVGEDTTVAPITGKYNETITLPTVTAPEGYTITLNNNYGENQTNTQKQTQRLEKWTTQEGTEIRGTTYTFGEKNDTITAVYVREPVTLGDPLTRPGYKFNGWYTEAINGTKVNNEYEPTGDIELYAHWTAEKYTVTFEPGENATVNPTSKEVTYGGKYGELPVPTKVGGRFLGWYKGETEITAETVVDITGPVTLIARWEGEVYTLTINLNGGKVGENTTVAPITGNYNETITLPTVTAPEGYTITLNNNYGENQTSIKKQTQRLEKWTTQDGGEITGTTYTFEEKNDTITAVYVREPVTLGEPLTRPGYKFDGWYTEATNGTKVNNEYEPTQDVELFAHWIAEKYTVTFEPGENATVNPTSKEVTYGQVYGTLPTPTKSGGTFLGWYNGETQITENDIVEITNNITLTAKWEETIYTLTINLNGGKVGENTTVAPITGKYNETVAIPTVTAPEGYTVTLNNNYGENQTSTKKQTQRLEKWTTQDGGEITGTTYTFREKNDTITAVYVREPVTLGDPLTRPGYKFDGWYTEATNGTKVNNEYEPTQDVELFAHWIAEKYTVTFNPGENATVNPTSKEVTYGEVYGTLPVPTKTGGKFLGWYNGETQITKDDIVEITNDITLTARWEGEVYTLTINLNGGKVGENTTIAPITGNYGETITIPTVTAPEGYTITLNNNYGENQTSIQKQTQRLEKWTTQDGGEITGTTYTFGEKDDTITAIYVREPVTLETPEERTGYTFDGWYTEATNGIKVNNQYEPTGNTQLFAHWIAEKYTITFNPGNNATVDTTSKEVSYEEKYGTLPIPQKPGYEFNGWYDGDKEITEDDIVKITNDTTLTAKWLGAQFTVTFDYGEGQGTETTRTVRNEGTYGQLPEATREGYEFIGWYNDNGNKIESTTIVNLTGNITLHARYSVKTYTVKFLNDDGSVLEEKTANYGDTVTYTGEIPEKENIPAGYNVVFAGWDNETKLQNIKENVTLTATYLTTPITYTITYENTKNADNTKNPVSYTIEDNDIILHDLENQGKYVFKGWYTTNDDKGIKITSIDTSKLENIILYAQWEKDGLYLKSQKYKIGENNIDIYEENDVYLDKIEPETTVTEFINNCETNGNIIVINQEGQQLQANDLVGTNMTIKVTRYDEEINLTSVVMGDLDGNGLVTPTDLSDVNKIVLKVLNVEGAKFKAADIDDTQKITPTDLSDINKTILGLIKLTYLKK